MKKERILAEFSIFPLDKGQSLSRFVARALKIIDESGLKYRLGPMSTCIEGSWYEIFDLVRKTFEALKKDCKRIMISLKIDYRKGRKEAISYKTERLEKILKRKLLRD
jgi:uncharacterized protein (TIGR00106 family)